MLPLPGLGRVRGRASSSLLSARIHSTGYSSASVVSPFSCSLPERLCLEYGQEVHTFVQGRTRMRTRVLFSMKIYARK